MRGVLLLVMVFSGLAGTCDVAWADGPATRPAALKVTGGSVVEVNETAITVAALGRGKDGKPLPPEKFAITSDTKITTAEKKPGTSADVKVGQQVTVVASGETATQITIMPTPPKRGK